MTREEHELNLKLDHENTIRDVFASRAISVAVYFCGDLTPEGIAADAYKLADAMIEERRKRLK